MINFFNEKPKTNVKEYMIDTYRKKKKIKLTSM